MQLPLQITARDIALTDAIETAIRDKAAKLETFYDRIMSCRVLVEAPHRHQHKGVLFNVRIDMTVPGAEMVVKREPHEDLYVSIRDAFDAARRQLQEHARRQRGEVKRHNGVPHARVVRIFPEEGYGFLTTPDDREVYFHANSVVNGQFERLEVGTAVRFAEEQGVEGPQASSVVVLAD
jgi:ribosomal subunit interface protein